MSESELIRAVLIEGAIGGAFLSLVAFLLSRFIGEVAGRGLLVILLITAAGAYFGFVIALGAGPRWLLVEVAHIVAFGALALLGFRGSPMWLAAGWALHPLWDVGLHYFGPGTFAPMAYAIACVTFDWVVAAYILVAYRFIGTRRMRFRDPVSVA